MKIIPIFTKLQLRHKGLYLLTLFIMSMLTLSILSFPFTNPVQYAIDYNQDDITATAEMGPFVSSISDAEDSINPIVAMEPVINYTVTYFSSYQVIYGSQPVNSEGFAVVKFDDEISTPLLKVPEIWYRDFGNNSVITDIGVFSNTAIQVLPSSTGYDDNFNGILTLPSDLERNFTSFYLGLELSKSQYRGINLEEINDKLADDIKVIREGLQSIFPNSVISDPVNDVRGSIDEQFSVILLQNFIILLLVIGSLVIALYYLQNWIYRKELNNYLILQHRGIPDETQYYYIPAMFVLFNLLLNLLVTLGLSQLLGKELSLATLLPASITIFTAVIASYNNVEAIMEMEPPDATEIRIDPSYLEYAFLILTIISALVNLYLNFPLIDHIELALVLVIYLSLGLLFSVILYFVSTEFRKIIVNRLDSRDMLSENLVISKYFQNILMRKLKNNFRVMILVGFVLLFASSHLYMTNQIGTTNENVAGTEVWGSYPYYAEISSSDISTNSQVSLMVPSTLEKLGVSLQGLILTDTNFVEYRPSLQRIENKIEYPSLWIIEELRRDFTYEILKSDGFSMQIRVGESNIEFNEISGTYPSLIQLPESPQFLFFLPETHLENYNELTFLIYHSTSSTISEDLQRFENQLDHQIMWVEAPRDNPITFALKVSIESELFSNPLFIYLVLGFTLIFLGTVQPFLLFRDEQQTIHIRGGRNSQMLISTLKTKLLFFPVYFGVTGLGALSIVTLIKLFNLLPLINLLVNLGLIGLFSTIAVICLFLGEIIGWMLLIIVDN